MEIENEIKVLNIDVAGIKTSLLKLGFKQGERQNYRRYVFDTGDKNTWLRLRTNGTITTLALKKYSRDTIDGVEELEVNVEDFTKTYNMLLLLGLKETNYQENQRLPFYDTGVEISIDEWPRIPAYLEIEAKTAGLVKKYMRKLSLDAHETTSSPTSEVYKKYGIDISNEESLTFRHKN